MCSPTGSRAVPQRARASMREAEAVSAGAEPQAETWGQLGPAMQALNERHRAFVRDLVTGKPGHGALTRAYRVAGYKSSNASTLSKEAHKLSRDPRIIEAIAEEAKKVIRGLG